MPQSLDGVIIHSHGCRLLGTLWRADTTGRHPTVLPLHGIPGVEKNYDLAYALREAGWNVLAFHYRGCWGSEGDYSLPGIVDDVRAAVDFLENDPGADMRCLAGVGLSLGGWAVIAAAADDQRLRAIVSMNPLVDPQTQPLDDETFAGFASMLNGITPDEVRAQWQALTPAYHLAPRLAGRPVLLFTGDLDELFPPYHIQPLAGSMPFAEWSRLAGASHMFTDHRREMVKTVVDWLARAFSPPLPISPEFSIRPPIETDHARVLAVLSDWWGGRDLSALLPRLYFQHFNDTSFVVEQDGALVAFLIGFLSQCEPGTAYVHFVGVHPAHRRGGLARALYERFFQLARARGAREVHLITAPVNSGSIAFHTRMGFEAGEPVRDYDGVGGDRIKFKKAI
jgi:GNAT superfamily N-acetyltransferase/alpha/beta superfamily hydrolase